MAPEQARGEPATPASDLFSLGAVLYRMCTGRLPFPGTNALAILSALGTQTPRPVRELAPAVPPALAELVMGLLAKDPAGRPGPARAVAERLLAFERGPAAPPARSRRRRGLLVALAVLALVPAGCFCAGPTIRFATNKGEVVIETDDPDVEVKIRDGTVIVHDWAKNRKYALTAGDYDLEVREAGPDGPRLRATRFSLNRGGREVVTARLVPVKAPEAKPGPAPGLAAAPAVDADRAAAEWLLSVKRDPVTVRVGGRERAVRSAKDLPAGPFEVDEVNLWGNPVVTDAGLAHLTRLAHLRLLELHDTRVGDDGLSHLRGLPALELLSLRFTLASDAGLAHLRDLPRLANLDLAGTRVSDAGLGHFRDLPSLARLSLNGTRVTDAGLGELRALPGLERLELELTGVTDAGLAALRGTAKLRHLFLGGTGVTDEGLRHLRALPALNVISLWGTRVSDEGLRHLGAVPGLYEVWLDASLLTDAGLGHLRALQGLVILKLYRGGDADLARLAALPKITALALSFSRVTDAGLEHLTRMAGLKTVILKASGVTAAGADRLRKLLPGCDVQWQPWGDETDRHAVEWVLATGGKARLQWMAAEWPAEALGDLPGGKLSLSGVDLGGCRRVADADLARLRPLPALRVVNLSGTGVTDTGLAHFQNLQKLSYLDLSGTAVTDAGLAHLATLRNLAELSLSDIAVTDAGLAYLRGLAQLRALDLTGAKVTDAGVADLRHALPRCQVRTGPAE
jgi:hypothetical protein